MASQDWTRLQHQYCEEQQRKGGGRGSNSGGQRTHGPPPPYHQTPRSASVPIATHSPSPNSPQNLTSTLSLPSPRGTTLASPSDSSRHGAPLRHLSAGQSPVSGGSPAALSRPLAQSSPATPSSAHLSPCSGPFKVPYITFSLFPIPSCEINLCFWLRMSIYHLRMTNYHQVVQLEGNNSSSSNSTKDHQ